MRIDEIVAMMLPDIEAHVMRANREVTDAILAHGWTPRQAVRPRQRQRAAEPAQYEMRV